MEGSITESDKHFMSVAMKFAYEALEQQEVPVGCIFIYNNEVIATGRNTVNETKNATRHAEFNCIDQVYDYCQRNKLSNNDVFKEINVYVTVEPCIMCAAALYNLSVKSIVYGCKNDRFGGETVLNVKDIITPNVCTIKSGLRADEALKLLRDFYNNVNPNAPIPKVKGKKGRKNV